MQQNDRLSIATGVPVEQLGVLELRMTLLGRRLIGHRNGSHDTLASYGSDRAGTEYSRRQTGEGKSEKQQQ